MLSRTLFARHKNWKNALRLVCAIGGLTTLLYSMQCGSDGFGGVSANYYPYFFPWMVENALALPEKASKLQRCKKKHNRPLQKWHGKKIVVRSQTSFASWREPTTFLTSTNSHHMRASSRACAA